MISTWKVTNHPRYHSWIYSLILRDSWWCRMWHVLSWVGSKW